MTEIVLDDVTKLRLEPGDVLVVRLPTSMPGAVLEHIAEAIREKFPTTPALMVADGIDLAAVSLDPEQYERLLSEAFTRLAANELADRVAVAIVDSILPLKDGETNSHLEAQRQLAGARARKAFLRV